MKKTLAILISCLLLSQMLFSQDTLSTDTAQSDLTKKQIRKAKHKADRAKMTKHFIIGFDAVYSYLNSTARVEGVNGIFGAKIDLEKHIGLEDTKMIYSTSLIWRATPRSGFYGVYYQLNRKKDHMLEEDIVFLGDTIQQGVLIGGHLKTSILSVGYLLSILTEQKSFLGAYFNAYVIEIGIGVKSDVLSFEKSARYFAAWPNFGIIASFDVTKWLTLTGSAGMFFIDAGEWNAVFHDLHLLTVINPTNWLGISIGYHVFDVSAGFPFEYINAYVDYNYKGPSIGVMLKF